MSLWHPGNSPASASPVLGLQENGVPPSPFSLSLQKSFSANSEVCLNRCGICRKKWSAEVYSATLIHICSTLGLPKNKEQRSNNCRKRDRCSFPVFTGPEATKCSSGWWSGLNAKVNIKYDRIFILFAWNLVGTTMILAIQSHPKLVQAPGRENIVSSLA